MKRYQQAAREEITRDYQESGLPIWQYCQQHGLSEASLKRWTKEFRKPVSETPNPGISLVEIQTPKTVLKPQTEIRLPALTIRFPNGISIELGHGTDVSWISQVMELVGQIA